MWRFLLKLSVSFSLHKNYNRIRLIFISHLSTVFLGVRFITQTLWGRHRLYWPLALSDAPQEDSWRFLANPLTILCRLSSMWLSYVSWCLWSYGIRTWTFHRSLSTYLLSRFPWIGFRFGSLFSFVPTWYVPLSKTVAI